MQNSSEGFFTIRLICLLNSIEKSISHLLGSTNGRISRFIKRMSYMLGFSYLYCPQFYLLVRYSMDYLFGGFSAYAAEVAGHDAAYVATKSAKEAVLVASGGAGGAGGGGPFRKRQ